MYNVFKFIDHFYPTSPKENFEFCFYGRLFSKNERGIPQKDKITVIVKNHNDALPMFCYFNYGDFGETAAFIEDKTHIKLICEPEIEFYSLNPEIFHFSICSLFREKLMDLLNEFTYLELTSIQPFLKGNDRCELIGLIDLAINGYRKLKASVYLSEDDDFLGGKNQSSKNSKELVEDLDLHFLMDIKEVLTKHPDFLSNVKEVVAFDNDTFKEAVIDANTCQYTNKTIYSLKAINSRKPITSVKTYIDELNDLCNYLPKSPDLNLFRKNEYHYSINDIEFELKEINIGAILTKHNKFYAYDDTIREYISDEIVSKIKPYLDDSGLKFTFRDSNIQSYIDLFTNDKFYFLDQTLAESLLVDIKKLNDACKSGSLMKMIDDLCDDTSSNLLNDIERKINLGKRMLCEIHQALVLELEKNQDTNVI
jgi:hypothetical protein